MSQQIWPMSEGIGGTNQHQVTGNQAVYPDIERLGTFDTWATATSWRQSQASANPALL